MATSPKLQQTATIFTEENISRNSLYMILIVCIGYFMHTETFTELIQKFNAPTEKTETFSGKGKVQKVKIAGASIGNIFETPKRNLATSTRVAKYKTSGAEVNKSVAFSKDEVLGNTKLIQAYIKRYAPVAKIEEREMAIPAAITMAQGILESGAGTTKSSQLANNHFAKTCHLSKCHKNHCKNIAPESRKDFYVIYQNSWQSFRAHSESLYSENRFQSLYRIPKSDYKKWAKGLEKAGYSREKNYAAKLIYLIETYKLNNI
jgi:flagellum-specific peptidoglycan hydrolase FlgJ